MIYPDGRFVVLDSETNTIFLMSPSLQELGSISGEIYAQDPEQLQCFSSQNGDLLLWRKSKHTIAIVNLTDFKVKKEISNFWTYKEFELKDRLAICDENMMNIIGVSELQDGARIFHHYTKEGKVVNAQMNSLMPDLNRWSCVSMCNDQTNFFVSGTSSLNPSMGVLFAVFESTVPIKIVTAIKVPKVQIASKVQRVKGTDVYLVACDSDIMCAQFQPQTNKLELINKIKSLGDTGIQDFCFRKYYCYVLMQNSNKLMILNFKPGRQKSPSKYMKYKEESTQDVHPFGVDLGGVKQKSSRYTFLESVQNSLPQSLSENQTRPNQITSNESKLSNLAPTATGELLQSTQPTERLNFSNISFSGSQASNLQSSGVSKGIDQPQSLNLGSQNQAQAAPSDLIETPRDRSPAHANPGSTPPSTGPKQLKSLSKSNKKKRDRNISNNSKRQIQRVTVNTEFEISPRKETTEEATSLNNHQNPQEKAIDSNTSRTNATITTLPNEPKQPQILQIPSEIKPQHFQLPNAPHPTQAQSMMSGEQQISMQRTNQTTVYTQIGHQGEQFLKMTQVTQNQSFSSFKTDMNDFDRESLSKTLQDHQLDKIRNDSLDAGALKHKEGLQDKMILNQMFQENLDRGGRNISQDGARRGSNQLIKADQIHALAPRSSIQSMPAINNSERIENITPQKKIPQKIMQAGIGKENFLAVLPEVTSTQLTPQNPLYQHFSQQSSHLNLDQTHGTLRSLAEGSTHMLMLDQQMVASGATYTNAHGQNSPRPERKITEISLPADSGKFLWAFLTFQTQSLIELMSAVTESIFMLEARISTS